MTNEPKARVFLSCGQRPDEMEIAVRIKKAVGKLGYEVYVATEQHTPDGFKDDIYRNLENSEYFLFIDFKREKLKKKEKKVYRGSLFSNQELAIASYLGLDVLGFQEEGVEDHSGIMQFVMVNPTKFKDRNGLEDVVINEVRSHWKTGWQRRVDIILSQEFSHVEEYSGIKKPGLWFHLVVRNLHISKQALNCTGFVVEVTNKDGKQITPGLSELKWKGITIGHQVVIPPQMERKLDAFHIFKDSPNQIVLGVNLFLVDSTSVVENYTLKGPGIFRVRYRVYSDNFPPADVTVCIDVDSGRKPYLKLGCESPPLEFRLDVFEKPYTGRSTTASTVLINIEAGTVSVQAPRDHPAVKICPKCGNVVNFSPPICNRCGAILSYGGEY